MGGKFENISNTKIEAKNRRTRGGNVNNVQYKSNQNCHFKSSLYNEYFLIKILFKKEIGEKFHFVYL
jgi:hypothetical protein